MSTHTCSPLACIFLARKLLFPPTSLTHGLLHTDILMYIQIHIHTLAKHSNIHKLKFNTSLTFKTTYPFTCTHCHTHTFTHTCSNMHPVKWPRPQIPSNWSTNIYSQMLPLTPSLTHVIHTLKMQTVFTWRHAHKHVHIHLGAQMFTHRIKYTQTSFCVHAGIFLTLICSRYINQLKTVNPIHIFLLTQTSKHIVTDSEINTFISTQILSQTFMLIYLLFWVANLTYVYTFKHWPTNINMLKIHYSNTRSDMLTYIYTCSNLHTFTLRLSALHILERNFPHHTGEQTHTFTSIQTDSKFTHSPECSLCFSVFYFFQFLQFY